MTDNRPEPRTEAGRRMLRRRSYWSGNDDIRAAILAIEAEAAQGAAPLLRSREEEMAIRMAKPIADLFGSLPAHDPATCRRCVPRAEGLREALEHVLDVWPAPLPEEFARLHRVLTGHDSCSSRPSDERVPESGGRATGEGEQG